MITGALVLAAIAYLFWPAASKVVAPAAADLFTLPAAAPVPAAPPKAPDPRTAIDSLLEVRDRLAASEQLDEEASRAVDILWLDLLHGSRQK